MLDVERLLEYAYTHVSTVPLISEVLGHVLPLYVAEPCTLDLQAAVTPQGCLPYFVTDMLPFQVTVSPDVQLLAIPGLGLDVLGNGLFVLYVTSVLCR
jgi:hypothetical protein